MKPLDGGVRRAEGLRQAIDLVFTDCPSQSVSSPFEKMPPRAPPPRQARPRILLVDDDDHALRALQRSLSPLRCDVSVSHNEDEALKLAREAPPALVIADITLVEGDGHKVVRRLREEGVNAAVIMISGRSDNQDVFDSLANGAIGCVHKPWSTPDLLNMVARALRLPASQDR